MKLTDIYQTLENRQNYSEIENNGPYFVQRKMKWYIKERCKRAMAWWRILFWDTRIEDAHWWGNTIYGRKGYVVCHTKYDQHSPFLYDLVGDISLFDEFIACAEFIKKKFKKDIITFPVVLNYLKKSGNFNYKAIRVWPYPNNMEKPLLSFLIVGWY